VVPGLEIASLVGEGTRLYGSREKPESGQASLFRDTVEILRTLPLVHPLLKWNYGCGRIDATNAAKHSIDQSEDRILQINQSKNASKHL